MAESDHAAGIGSSACPSEPAPPPQAARPTASSVTSASVVVRIRRTVPPGDRWVRARSVTPAPGGVVATAAPGSGAILPRMRRRHLPAIAALAIAATAAIAPAAGASPTGSTGTTDTTVPSGTALLHVTPTAKYVTAARGTVVVGKDRIAWHLDRAPGTSATTCWRWISKPAPRTPRYNGERNALCQLAVPADADPADVPQVVAQSARGSRYGLVAVQVPKGTSKVQIGFAGGRLVTAPVSKTGLITWAGKQAPLYLAMRLPGSHKVECAAGALTTRSDLSDPQLTMNAVGTPFICEES